MSNFFKLVKEIVHNGDAYRLIKGQQHTDLMKALSDEPERIETFFELVQQSGIPDGNLPVDSLDDWETFLALPRNDSLSTTERNERITGKYTSQGGQGPDYIQDTMQAAGFPVYVVENFPSVVDPHTLTGVYIPGPPVYEANRRNDATLGGITLGSKTLGAFLGTTIDPIDVPIPIAPTRYRYIWFLTGSSGINDFVNIPIARKEDFLNQILQIKPAHTPVLAQVNFV